jgi:hypothetical protein
LQQRPTQSARWNIYLFKGEKREEGKNNMEQEEEEEKEGEKLCIVHLPSRQSTFWAGPFLILLGLVALPGDQPKVFDSPPPLLLLPSVSSL